MSIGKFLGAALGVLIPGVGPALGAAIGSGVGSLVIDKDDPKDAIKNALMFGAGAALFPGVVGAFKGSAFGQAATSGLASLGLGNMAAYAGQQAAAPLAAGMSGPIAPAGAVTGTAKGIGGLFGGGAAAGGGGGILGGNPLMLYSGLSALGALEQPQETPFEETYASRYTGVRYATPEERDRAEEAYAMNKLQLEGPRLQQELDRPRSARGYAMGGYVEGPGTGRSDSIPATIYQNGQPVEDARLSDGEFVMTERAVRGAGNGDRDKGAAKMYAMMRQFERGMA
jgi:hypothetical protein